MLRLGLTGGIGAGKSTVARVLTELGAHLVDADRIAREVVEPGTAGLALLVEAFGDGIVGADGGLDRPALAAIAFADEDSRARLNAIMHPLIGERTQQRIDQAPPGAIIVQDIPLLVEGGMAPLFDLVLVVDLDAEIRLSRLIEHRGMDEADARARMAAQASDSQRRAVADVLIDNRGTPAELEAAVRALWHDRLVPFEQARRAGRSAPIDPTPAPADPDREGQGRRAVTRLAAALAPVRTRVIHLGPTAVPGLDAPDVLDIAVAVADPAEIPAVIDLLAGIGYPVDPEAAGVLAAAPGAELRPGGQASVCVSADPGRVIAVHVVPESDPGLHAAEQALAAARTERSAGPAGSDR